jgi:hypothetical protein
MCLGGDGFVIAVVVQHTDAAPIRRRRDDEM